MSSALRETGRHASPPAVRQPAEDTESFGELVKEASTHLSTLMRSEVELAKLEIATTAKKAGISVALFAVAGVIIAFSLTFGFIGLAEGLHAVGLSRWIAYLLVFGFLLLVAIVSALIGLRIIKRVGPPQRTITTAKDTVAWAKHPTHT